MIKKLTIIASIIFVFIFSVSLHANVANAEGFVFTRDITIGSRGDDVSALQQILIDSGFLKITAPTGYFGPITKTALSTWQTSRGVSPAYGYFGSISRGEFKLSTIEQALSQNTTLISGCTSTSGFSTTTGTPCTSASTISPPITVPPTANILQISTPPTSSATILDKGVGLPVRIKIPKINVDAGFQYNGLTSDGAMEIPNNVVDVGWFTGSARPGENGTSVITGHVAQIRGGVVTKPGVFFTLKDLSAGDTLAVINDKGESTTFIVRETRNYDPLADATNVFTSNDNYSHLNIITCEGTWHPDQLSYSQRLVVFTNAVK